MVDSVSVRFKNARVEKVPLNIRMQWNAGTACVSECVLKTLWRVGVCVSALLSSETFLHCHHARSSCLVHTSTRSKPTRICTMQAEIFAYMTYLEVGNLVAQCSATPASVAPTPPCSATPFQWQLDVRHP